MGLVHARAVAVDVEQPEGCRRLIDLCQHLAEKGLVLRGRHARSGVDDQLAEWDR